MIYTGTTPTLTLQFSREYQELIESASGIIVTFSEPVTRQTILEKRDYDLAMDMDEESLLINVFLTQEETLKMPTKGDVLVQVNFVFDGGEVTYRASSDIGRIEFRRNLKNEVANIEIQGVPDGETEK